MNIKEQMQYADGLLAKLEVVDPYVILAGGAPRDWHMGKEANDLDFYIYSHAMTVATFTQQIFCATGLSVVPTYEKNGHNRSVYATMRDLRGIYEAQGDMPINIILMDKPGALFTVVDQMSCSICKYYYKKGKVVQSRQAKATEITKCIGITEGYTMEDPHIKKMKERFSGEGYYFAPEVRLEGAVYLKVTAP